MSYTVSVNAASSVRHAVCADFLVPDELAVVLARPAAVDVYAIEAGGLSLRHTVPVHGRITALQAFKPAGARTAWLFVFVDDCTAFTAVFRGGRLETQQVVTDIDDRIAHDTDSDHIGAVEPFGRGVLLYFRQGSLTYLPLEKPRRARARDRTAGAVAAAAGDGTLYAPVQLSLDVLIVVSLVFLHTPATPTVAVLFRDSAGAGHVRVYEINTAEGVLDEVAGAGLRNVDRGATMLMPVPHPLGGFFLLGEQLLTYVAAPRGLSPRPRPVKQPLDGPRAFCAWAAIDDDGTRFLLGDDGGRLHMLLLDAADPAAVSWDLRPVGETAIPTTLTYLDAGFFFVTSHFSPSTLFQLAATEPYVRPVQVMPNLAPITDFQLVETDAAVDVVACSGGFKSGALRIVRTGVGVDALAELAGLPGVCGLWAVRDVVVASFVQHTRVFRVDPDAGAVDELAEWAGLDLGQPTVALLPAAAADDAAGAAAAARAVHVGPAGAVVIDLETLAPVASWTGEAVAAAAATPSAILVASALNTLTRLDWALAEQASIVLDNEISALAASADVVAVGQWISASISLFSLAGAGLAAAGTAAGLAGTVPRSLALATLDTVDQPVLLAGMADGTLHTFALGAGGEPLAPKSTVIGTQPVTLYHVPGKAVLATSSRATIVYGAAGKLTYSSVNLQPPAALARMRAPGSDGDMIVYAVDDTLAFGVIDQIMSTHVQTLELDELARRLTVLPPLPAAAATAPGRPRAALVSVVTLKTELDEVSGDEVLRCAVKLVDMALFEVVDSYALHENEMAESIVSGTFGPAGAEADPDAPVYVVVGTGSFTRDQEECTKGRLLVFEVTAEHRLSLVLSTDIHGAAYALAVCGTFLVNTVNSVVRLSSLAASAATGELSLTHHCGFRAPSVALSLSTHGSSVLVGDLMKAAVLLRVARATDGSGDYRFEEVARYYEPMWTTDVELLDAEHAVVAEAEGNLVVFARPAADAAPATDLVVDADPALEVVSSYRVGEMVNRVRRVTAAAAPGAPTVVRPRAYYATVDGGIYMTGDIAPEYVNVLLNLQYNMAKVVRAVGSLDLLAYRGFCNQRRKFPEPVRFVDGDYVETFLELAEADKAAVVAGASGGVPLETTVEELTALVEDLKRLH
ncbi:CPSF A subunit region-domain-containing protein [Dipodascopsis tothii]|uniref:CPSF A subunit region-domain-containing protein n=1 Tax=Dipodascopsis tothii TaxID=44089 RepID=UPI0034CEAC18